MSSQRHGAASSICLPINFMLASAILTHPVPNDDVISTSERCISGQDFPYRRRCIDIRCDITSLRYDRRTFCPARVTGDYSGCRGSTLLDFLYGPTAKSCIIKALRVPLAENYIKEKTSRDVLPQGKLRSEARLPGTRSLLEVFPDPSNLFAKIMLVHVPSKILVLLRSTFPSNESVLCYSISF